ncbi:hypothetical protein BD779DRAFT_1790730 [Infundibulicybe gibba]|nr:hypothetical protein BD779DRAFT_1790730 [Infundibulicybe gibba]
MSNRRVVTVLYCEKELQRTVLVPPSFTMAQAEAAAAKELVDHLRRLPGLSLDNKRIHIYFLARLFPGTNSGDPDASGESIQGQTSSQPSFQAHPVGHIYTMTAIYSGATLTLSFPSSTTVADVKAVVLKEVLDQIRCYPKISPTIALDDTCVDICPGGSTPDTRMGDLCASGEFTTMVVWPKAAPGSTIMPSPLADVLADLNAEKLRLQELKSEISKLEQIGELRAMLATITPANSLVHQYSPCTDSDILERISTVKAKIRAMEAGNEQHQAEKAGLQSNVDEPKSGSGNLSGVLMTWDHPVPNQRLTTLEEPLRMMRPGTCSHSSRLPPAIERNQRPPLANNNTEKVPCRLVHGLDEHRDPAYIPSRGCRRRNPWRPPADINREEIVVHMLRNIGGNALDFELDEEYMAARGSGTWQLKEKDSWQWKIYHDGTYQDDQDDVAKERSPDRDAEDLV